MRGGSDYLPARIDAWEVSIDFEVVHKSQPVSQFSLAEILVPASHDISRVRFAVGHVCSNHAG